MTFTVKLDLENAVDQMGQIQGSVSAAGSAYEGAQGALSSLADGSSNSDAAETVGALSRSGQETESINAVIGQAITAVEQYKETI
ncbi:hypothetical protein [Haloglycomyces albus]|uniref:hypothetical protein n=1 Tax=Haloglycomyces albus TaxID=526067 RepID=UPI00046CD7BA|nr:hypothetical protein [Haloglycomyces albus]